MSSTANRRLQKEYLEIKGQKINLYKFADSDGIEKNCLEWNMLLTPQSPPYNKGVFKFTISFPTEYPFKPPKILFKSKIYHPNIDEKGQICLPIISPENWKPATKADQVLNSLMEIIQNPEAEHPLRADVAEEYTKDRKKFLKNAEEQTKKYCSKK